MKISEKLYTFFKEWLEWAKNGGKDGCVFCNHAGLCSNFDWWSDYNRLARSDELLSLLEYSGLDTTYPFGKKGYHRRLLNDTQHKCPRRLAFVRKHHTSLIA